MSSTTQIVFDSKLVNEEENFLRRSAFVEYDNRLYEVEYTLILTLPNGPSITPVIKEIDIDSIPEADDLFDRRLPESEREKREEEREKIYDGVEIALCNHYGVPPTFKQI